MFFPANRKVELEPTPIFLDVKGEGTTFISHAHSDHAVKSAHTVISTPETMSLLRCRNYVKKSVQHVSHGQIAGAKVTLLNAGHIFGSSQIKIEKNDSTFLYTGDLALSESLTAGSAELTQCDELLIECTFGLPRYVFQPRMEVGQQVGQWALKNEKRGAISIVGGYSLGKAQEVIAHLNEAGITPVVPTQIANVSKCYNDHGAKLNFVDLATHEGQSCLKGGFTAVFPLNEVSTDLGYVLRQGYSRDVRLAHCSGWCLSYSSPGITGFPLSDHADFNDLTKFVEYSGAKKVHCVYGSSQEFAASLRRKGIDASAIVQPSKKTDGQSLLTNFQAV